MTAADRSLPPEIVATARDRLEALVRVESPSGDTAASAAAAALLERWWRQAGAAVRVVETSAGSSVIADLAGVGDPVLLVGHSDTVWPVGALAGDVPWVAQGDLVRGPGVFDMKSGLVIMLAAVEHLRGHRHRAVRAVIVCDEEIGSPTTRQILAESAEGVAAALGFEAPHPDGGLKVGRRGSTRLLLRVRGKAAHAALDPDAGVSAIDELVDQLIAVREIVDDPALPGVVLCNVGTISGGTRANVVSAHAEAELGLRFVDAESEHRVLTRIEALSPRRPGAVLEVTRVSHRPTWVPTPGDRAVADTLARAAHRCGMTLSAAPAAGAGDTNLLGSWGVPTVDGLGPRGAGAHAVDEHILLSSFAERIALVASFLGDIAEDM